MFVVEGPRRSFRTTLAMRLTIDHDAVLVFSTQKANAVLAVGLDVVLDASDLDVSEEQRRRWIDEGVEVVVRSTKDGVDIVTTEHATARFVPKYKTIRVCTDADADVVVAEAEVDSLHTEDGVRWFVTKLLDGGLSRDETTLLTTEVRRFVSRLMV